jgi:acetyltransferase-like isoleucine patch superfamily enzyme
MRGREMFRRAYPAIQLLEFLLRGLPAPIVRALWSCISNFEGRWAAGLRYVISKRLALRVGDVVYFGPRVTVKNWQGLSLGSNVSIHNDCYLDAIGGLSIGDDVSIAHMVSLVSFEHSWGDTSLPIRENPVDCKPISIAGDVWIGAGARVLAGAQVGQRVVIAANAVVKGHTGSGVLLAGVPARVVRQL